MRFTPSPRLPGAVPALRFTLFSLTGALALASLAGAQGTRVTAALRGVTAEQATEQLSRLASVPVRVYTADVPGAARSDSPRADFQWSDLTFAQALRQLCERFALRPSRGTAGYILYPNPAVPGPKVAARKIGLFEKDGLRLFARSVTFFENRQINFQDGAANAVGGAANLQLYVTAELGDRDAESLAGFQNVVARDDLGHALGQQGTSNYNAYYDGAFPDEWTSTISLPAPHPKARKLVSVEGDVMVFRKVRPLQVEIPLPLTGKSVRKQVDDLSFWVGESRVREVEPDDEPEPLLNRAQQAQGLVLRTRVYSPAQGGAQGRWGWGMTPYLVGASGRVYQANQLQSTSGSDGVTMVTQNVLSFPNLSEPPARLVWDLLDRSEPVKLFSFRMTDIPLPGPLAFNARAAAPLPPEKEPVEDRPFYDRAGGSLIVPIEVPGRMDVDGILDLGLAARAGAGWGPLRWVQVDVAGGIGRLDHVKPGAYRLMRRFRLTRGTLPKEGAWHGEQVLATVTPGKELRLAPLRWGPRAAPVKPGK